MKFDRQAAKEIFLDAFERGAPEQEAFVREACAGDAALRAAVEELLAAHDQAASFMPSPTFELSERTPAVQDCTSAAIGERIGPYQVVSKLGEGGFGIVYEANQTEPVRRRVALKLLKAGMDTRQVVARFQAERQTLAMMDHPGIATVYDAGATAQGRPYFVMELVQGQPVTTYCDDRRLNIARRLELFEQVCNAVHHAHQKGVIHRDIKPNNVLVAVVDGKPLPKVIDFGIAKCAARGPDDHDDATVTHFTLTHEHQVLGTPEYMSPEQISRGQVDVDTRSDIYSLGVLLYRLLCGHGPYELERMKQASLGALEQIICHEEPPRPSVRLAGLDADAGEIALSRDASIPKLYRSLRGELDWVVMRAISKDPDRRYPSVYAFAADIRRFLHHEPVEAGPPSSVYRLKKFYHRHRALALAGMGVVAILLVATVVSLFFANSAIEARNESQRRLLDAYVAQARAARSSRLPGRRFDSLQAIACAAEIRPTPQLRNEAIGCMALFDIEHVRSFETDDAVSAEGLRDVDRIAIGGDAGEVIVRTIDTHQECFRLRGPPMKVIGIRFSPQGYYLAASYAKDDLRRCIVWDTRTGESVIDIPRPVHLGEGSVFADQKEESSWFCWTTTDGVVHISDLPSGEERFAIPVGGRVTVASGPNARKLALTSYDSQQLEIWDIDAQMRTAALTLPSAAYGLDWRNDGKLIALAGDDRAVYLLDPATGTIADRLIGHQAQVIRVFWMQHRNMLATWSWDGTARIWDTEKGIEVFDVFDAQSILGVGGRLVTQFGRRIDVWNIGHSSVYKRIAAFELETDHTNVGIHPDGRFAITSSRQYGLCLWDLHRPGHTTMLDASVIQWMRVANNGQVVLGRTSGGDVSTLEIWTIDYESEPPTVGETKVLWRGRGFKNASVNDAVEQVSICTETDLHVIDLASGEQLFQHAAYPGMIGGNMSPDGRYVFTGQWRGEACRVWDLQTGEVVKFEPAPHVTGKFSPNGDRLLVTYGKHADLFHVGDWSLVARIPRKTEGDLASAIAFSRDGSFVVMRDSVTSMMLLDPQTGERLAELPNPDHLVPSHMELSRDANTLVAVSPSKFLQVWNLGETRKVLRSMNLDWRQR